MTTLQLTKTRLLALLTVVLVVIATMMVAFAPTSTGAVATATKHYVANVSGAYPYDTSKTNYQVAASLGYNVLDVSSVSVVNTLPAGTQAMFWLGSKQKCPDPVDSTFTTTVNNLVPVAAKVYGVYLSDEPQTPGQSCPDSPDSPSADGPANIKARADYVKSKLPNVKTFIVIDNQLSFSPYRPAVTGVNLVGIDPYPFNVSGPPDYGKVAQRVGWATTGGWAKNTIVPTFQTFGQTCSGMGGDKYYRFPTDSELNTLLSTWEANGPFSELDYSYGWKNQLPDTACPTLVDKPSAQQIMKNYFSGATPVATTTSTPPPTTTTTTAVPTTTTTTAVPTQTVTRTVTATVTQTVTQPPVTSTVTVTPTVKVSELSCALAPTHPAPGDNVTCSYR